MMNNPKARFTASNVETRQGGWGAAKGFALAAIAVLVMLAGAGCSGIPSNSRTVAIDRAVGQVYPALVRVNVVMASADGGRMRKAEGSGSGVIISPQGHVVTNHHVAGRSTRVVCRLADRQEIDAVVLGTDPLTDISVLKLDLSQRTAASGPLPVAQFGDSSVARVGDTVLAMGSPAGLSQSVTVGVISNAEMIVPYGTGVQMEGEIVGTLVRWIGHDARIYPGNSGGPLVNLDGRVIGINEVGIGGLGGAIPSNLVREIAREIIQSGSVRRSWSGMSLQPRPKDMRVARGVLLSDVVADSPAAKAGLKPGDMLLSFDGVATDASVAEELPIINQLVLSRPVNRAIAVTVMRAGTFKKLSLTLAPREPAMGKDEEIRSWGMTAMDLTRSMALEFERADKDGVMVGTIRPGGPCDSAKPGLSPGDVIVEVAGQKVKNLAQLRQMSDKICAAGGQVPTLVTFDRGLRQYLTVVRVGNQERTPQPPSATKAWIGVRTQVLTRELVKQLNLPAGSTGVRVTQVIPETQAATAGLALGDIILTMDGMKIPATEVEDVEVFSNLVRKYDIGVESDLGVWRGGKMTKVKVKMEDSPTPVAQLEVYEDFDLEFTARELSSIDRKEKSLGKGKGGLLIESVAPASLADLGGLEGGDVLLEIDGQAIGDIDSMKKAMAALRKAKPRYVMFFVKRGIHTVYLQLEPAWKNSSGDATIVP